MNERWTPSVESLAAYRDASRAAACAFGLVRDHPYVDGTERVALVVMVAVLDRNWLELRATDARRVLDQPSAAAGHISEADPTDWIERHTADHSTTRTTSMEP